MNIGVGRSTLEYELNAIKPLQPDVPLISETEYRSRIEKASRLMQNGNIEALMLSCSVNLTYFTGLNLHLSERLHGAIISKRGEIAYIVPAFEKYRTDSMIKILGQTFIWEEDENPYLAVMDALMDVGAKSGTIAIDENTPFFVFDSLQNCNLNYSFVNASKITKTCRERKSQNELMLIKRAMDITLEVQKRTSRILKIGISTSEVQEFVALAHKKLGCEKPPDFNIVLFGEATAYPHGVPYSQNLKEGDMVLLDMGATVGGYYSDITRTYIFGSATEKQRLIWNLERSAQDQVFKAAQIGTPCENLDYAARDCLQKAGLGPGYDTPGLPHRTGHGLGLDVHEHPYIVKGNTNPLAEGMCFSNEPMICIYNEFGVRLEDHIYMTKNGPEWFTKPAYSIEDPFGECL